MKARLACFGLLVVPALAAAYTDAQRGRGAEVFRERCAACHGADGAGGRVPVRFAGLGALVAPPLAGPETLGRFRSAGEVATFVQANMPKDAPGSLPQEDALAVTALLLSWRGIAADARPLTADGAAAVALPGGRGRPGSAYYGRSDYPAELARRPLALPARMVELTLPVGIDASMDGGGRPTTVHPSTYVGVTRWLTLGVRSTSGFCRRGADGRCAAFLDTLTVDSIWNLYRLGPVEAAYGASLTAPSANDPWTLSADLRLALRATTGPVAVWLVPSYGFGVTRRDAPRVVAVAFPLASSLSFGTFEVLADNRAHVSAPLVVAAQVSPFVTVAGGIGVSAPLGSPGVRVADAYTIPAGAALVVTPARALDLGVAVTFPDLARTEEPARGRTDARTVQVFVAARP